MAYDPEAYGRELRENQARLNAITSAVQYELRQLGYSCAVDVSKSEGNPDAAFINFGSLRLNVRAHIVNVGAAKGRIEWHGFAHRREFHSSDFPRLPETSTAQDARASRIAKQIISRIVEPAAEAVARYNETADKWDAARAALPSHIARVNALGFKCEAKPGDTEAGFYLSRKGVSGSARINSDGGMYFDRLSLDAETARCVLEFLANRPKD